MAPRRQQQSRALFSRSVERLAAGAGGLRVRGVGGEALALDGVRVAIGTKERARIVAHVAASGHRVQPRYNAPPTKRRPHMIQIPVILLAAALSFLFTRTKFGIKLKAVSQDKTASYMMGINVKRMAMLGNCLGCGLGGIAGLLSSIYYQMLQATMGGSMGMKAFSSSVLGGVTDVRFSALGGLCIGIIENFGIMISSASFRDIFAFGFLIAVLIIKPTGFVSKRGVKV